MQHHKYYRKTPALVDHEGCDCMGGSIQILISAAMFACSFCFIYGLLSRKTYSAKVNKRREKRVPIRSGGTLTWSGLEGRSIMVAIKGVNVSNGGALVEAKHAVAPGCVVLVHFEAFHSMTTATVRHCTPSGFAYRIGLEFRHALMTTERGSWKIHRADGGNNAAA